MGKGLLVALLIVLMYLVELGSFLITIIGSGLGAWLLSSIIYRGKPMDDNNSFQEWITHFLMLVCLFGLVGFMACLLWSFSVERIDEQIICIFLSMLIIGFTPYYKAYQDGISK